jgi:hypothetical protein
MIRLTHTKRWSTTNGNLNAGNCTGFDMALDGNGRLPQLSLKNTVGMKQLMQCIRLGAASIVTTPFQLTYVISLVNRSRKPVQAIFPF